MISIKINCSAITKEKLYQGEKGKYLNAVLIETPNSQYGDFMIVEDVSREERAAGKKGVVLGNGKIIGRKPQQQPPPAQSGSGTGDVGY